MKGQIQLHRSLRLYNTKNVAKYQQQYMINKPSYNDATSVTNRRYYYCFVDKFRPRVDHHDARRTTSLSISTNSHCLHSKEKVSLAEQYQTHNDGKSLTVENVKMVRDRALMKVMWSEHEDGQSEGRCDVDEGSSVMGALYEPCAEYPWVWMRDNCQCLSCFHPSSHSRATLMMQLDLNIKPTTFKVIEDGTAVHIEWSDGHISRYSASWLHQRAFQSSQQAARASAYRLPRQYWGSELLDDLPRVEFDDLMISDDALLNWLQQLEIYGLVVVGGAPPQSGQVRRLVDRVAFIKKTHYGEDFDVTAKPNPSNVAYSSGPLQLHTDLPYYEYKPGVQLIHCLVQYEGNGGESQVSDAIHVARELRRMSPEKFDILRTTLVDWCDVGTDLGGTFCKILQQPVICTDRDGDNIHRINFSQPQRDSFFNVSVDNVALWYDAMKTYHDLLYHHKYCLQFKMLPGTIITFDNLRIVHGRTGYMSGVGERHVQGCYIDWDETRSRRRVLELQLGVNTNSSTS